MSRDQAIVARVGPPRTLPGSRTLVAGGVWRLRLYLNSQRTCAKHQRRLARGLLFFVSA